MTAKTVKADTTTAESKVAESKAAKRLTPIQQAKAIDKLGPVHGLFIHRAIAAYADAVMKDSGLGAVFGEAAADALRIQKENA